MLKSATRHVQLADILDCSGDFFKTCSKIILGKETDQKANKTLTDKKL